MRIALCGIAFVLVLVLFWRIFVLTGQRNSAREAASMWEQAAAANAKSLLETVEANKRLDAALTERARTLAALRSDLEAVRSTLKETLKHDPETRTWGGVAVPAAVDKLLKDAAPAHADSH
jgi:Skp family chaperone for outer membrane proteins